MQKKKKWFQTSRIGTLLRLRHVEGKAYYEPDRIFLTKDHTDWRFKTSSKSGFTLIELLIVMAIIGILTTVSIFALQSTRSAGRDARRKADLDTIRIALEAFRSDCGVYPSSLTAGSALTGSASLGCTPANTNTYIQAIPDDPQNPTSGLDYYYNRPTSNTFNLCSQLEGSTASSPSGCGTCGGATCRYKVTN